MNDFSKHAAFWSSNASSDTIVAFLDDLPERASLRLWDAEFHDAFVAAAKAELNRRGIQCPNP